MTAPGISPLPAPGWWVKRNRLVFPSPRTLTTTGLVPLISVASAGTTVTPARALLILTGFAPGINGSQSYIPTAASLTVTGSAPVITIAPAAAPLSIVGTPAAAAATTITLPTHAAGDIIVIGASTSAGTAPVSPAAVGSIPTWHTVDAGGDANGGIRIAYAVATGSAHTSGSWSGAAELAVIVMRGQDANPIGGHALSSGSSFSDATAPAVTMSKTDGTSFVLEFHFGGVGSWSGAPTGYTRRADVINGSDGLCLNTKDTTTSDGSVVQTYAWWGGISQGYRGATVEIVHVTVVVTPTGGSLVLTGGTPTVLIPQVVTPTGATLTLTGNTAFAGLGLRPGGVTFTLTGSAPSLTGGPGVAPTGATLTLTGGTPIVSTPNLATPTGATLTLTGSAPTVSVPNLVTPTGAALTLTGSTPIVATTLRPAGATLTLAAGTPVIASTLLPAGAALTVTGSTPVVRGGPKVIPTGGALTLTGGTPVVGLGLRPAGVALTVTGGTPTVISGTMSLQNVNTSNANTCIIGTHSAGDLIIIAAGNLGTFTATSPSMPGASGTVPAWNDELNNAGDIFSGALRVASFVATSNNHTSGTWTDANCMAAIVIHGPNAVTPIGGKAEAIQANGNDSTVPSITLTNSSGSSIVVQIYCTNGFNAGPTPTAGYTSRGNTALNSAGGIAVTTKDTTTSDGTATCTMSTGNANNRGAQIEILD